jgi:ABC-type proline/glycine betaine transport system permease subunit
MWSWRPLRAIIDPIVEKTRPLPPLAFIPLPIVWFGIGELPKHVLIVIGVVPIMIVSTVAGLDHIPSELGKCARTLSASRVLHLFSPANPRCATRDYLRNATVDGSGLGKYRRRGDDRRNQRHRLPEPVSE